MPADRPHFINIIRNSIDSDDETLAVCHTQALILELVAEWKYAICPHEVNYLMGNQIENIQFHLLVC